MALTQLLIIFLMLGIAQGLFLCVLLLTRRENAAANRILAGTMAAFALFLTESVLYVDGHFHDFPHLIGISQPVIFIFGPAIYLYARTVGGGAEKPGRRDLLHFVPAVLVVLYFLPFYLKPGPEKIAFVEALLRDGAPLDVEIIEWLKLPHGAAYTLVTFGVLRRYRRRLEESFSNLDRINLGWLRNILLGTMVVWVMAIVSSGLTLLGVRFLASGLSFAPLALVVFVYVIGTLGLRQPEVFWPPSAAAEPARAAAEPDAPAKDAKYRKSGLDPAKAVEIEKNLLALMDNEGYFRIIDRITELIRVGSRFVYPRDVEEVLHEHPSVQAAAATGMPGANGRGEVQAHVVLRPGYQATEEEIVAFCQDRLRSYQIPQRVHFRDQLPRSFIGKVVRRRLIEEELAAEERS